MSGTLPEDPLDRLHRELGFKRLNPLWAKLEIVLGLVAVAIGVVSAMKFAVRHETEWEWLAPVLLMTLGGYLTLAGHRSHLYQSNNRLAAHLAELIRNNAPKLPESRS